MTSVTQLKGVSGIGDSLLSDQLEFNALMFFQWASLGVGAFRTVRLPSNAYDGYASQLRLVNDPNYLSGQVWETYRKDWVWETGVGFSQDPIRVSGVYVDGTFQPATGVGTYAHTYDYPLGRVVFGSPISPSSTVRCEYSFRTWQFYTADAPWWQQVQPDSLSVTDPQFLQQGSGAWSTLSQNRVQLPAVVIEAEPRTDRFGYELGAETQRIRQDVTFHILTESRPDMKLMHDVITNQWPKRLRGVDKNKLIEQGKYPLDEQGSPLPSGLMYPDMVADLSLAYPPAPNGQLRFQSMRSVKQPRIGPIHYATALATFEVDLP